MRKMPGRYFSHLFYFGFELDFALESEFGFELISGDKGKGGRLRHPP